MWTHWNSTRNNLNYLAEQGWCLPQINISSVTWQIVCINHQRYPVPPCFSINIIYHEFITYITTHRHPVAIIYLFLISIGQKLICQPCRLLQQQLTSGLLRAPGRHPVLSYCRAAGAGMSLTQQRGELTKLPSSQSVDKNGVYAEDKQQQGLLGFESTGWVFTPILHRDSDYTMLPVSLEFIGIWGYRHPVPYAVTQFRRIHYTATRNHLLHDVTPPKKA